MRGGMAVSQCPFWLQECAMPATVEIHATIKKLSDSINSVFLGKQEVVELTMVALLGNGHILIEDVPGVGKTLLARAVARSVKGSFRRIQFTPDLLPGDIIGTSIYDSQTAEFVFKKGPLFASIILADEINRTSPRTQSALLEAMSESQVSVDGTTYHLDDPFLVLATQNPFEFEGTYPLPESQLDRFMLRLRIGYPPRAAERELLTEHRNGEPVDHLQPVVELADVRQIQQAVRDVTIETSVCDYLLDIVEATREHPELEVGVSTRGALMLYRASQAIAMLRGREYVVPDDVKDVAVAVMAHRMISKSYLSTGALGASETVVREILGQIPVPQ